MKVAFLVTDNRQPHRDYNNETPWFGTAPDALLQGFSRLPEIELHVVTCTQKPMRSPAKLADNIHFHSLHVPKIGWMRTGYSGCVRAMRRRVREIAPDIVHGQGTERECALSAVFTGFPNVITIHGNMRLIAQVNQAPPFSFYWLAARLEAFTLPRTHGVVCISTYTQKAVEPLAKKTWLVPNAVDSSFFNVQNNPARPPRLLCVGNVDQRKNQNALIKALDALNPTGVFEVVFLGRVDKAESYSREFLDLVAARPWCRYEGFIDREGLQQHLTAATAVILPTLEDNCPMVVLEAMAAGVPVAAGRVGGVPDLIRHEETGLLFDSRDPRALIQATQALLSPEAVALTQNARKEALARFHPENVAQRHLEIYREVVNTANSALTA